MAKKRKKNEEQALEGATVSFAHSETMRGVIGVFFLAAGIFFILSAFELGGFVGSTLFSWLSFLLGVGYALLPLSFFIAAFTLFKAYNTDYFGYVRLGGVVLFLLAALGLLNILLPGQAGIVGKYIAEPLTKAIDVVAATVFLAAFVCAALMISFDVHPGAIITFFKNRFSQKPEEIGSETTSEIQQQEPVATVSIEPDEHPDAVPQPEVSDTKESLFGMMGFEKAKRSSIRAHSVYTPPPLSILAGNKGKPSTGDIKANMNIIKRTLQNFGIEVEMDEVSIGPTVTRYALKPAEGVRLAKIVALQSNIELGLAASPLRIEAPIPGKSLVGIEVPNTSRTVLGLGPLLSDKEFVESDKPLLIALGRSITGQPHFADLARAPHLLIAGATGSGKSVMAHNIIVSLLYRLGPDQLRFVMVDPKRVELTGYNSIPHLLTPVITDPKKAIVALKWLAKEMARRYDILETEKVRDISSYHKNVVQPALERHKGDPDAELPETLPYIVVLIDELSEIMQLYPRELEAGIVRLAQMSRAVGIHLILSTQRPSVKVITGLIKANIPARIALQVPSQIDSRTILDMGGAEKLLGAGDMLFLTGEMAKPRRIQAPYISEDEVHKIVKHIVETAGEADASEYAINFSEIAPPTGGNAFGEETEDDDDSLYEEAKQEVVNSGRASTSYLQRKLRVGYSRAARLMDLLEQRGVIGPADGAKPRTVLGASSVPESDEAGGGEES